MKTGESIFELPLGREFDDADAAVFGERALLDALEAVHGIGYWVLDPQSSHIILSERAMTLLGSSDRRLAQGIDGFSLYFARGDRQGLQEKMLCASAQQTAFSLDVRTVHGRVIRLSCDPVASRSLNSGLCGFVEDITSSRRLKSERDKGRVVIGQLQSGLEHMEDGFAIYDPKDRLLYCNATYRLLYRESAPAIVRGAKFEDIIRFGLDRGQYPAAIGREAQWLEERLEAHRNPPPTPLEQRLAGGRWLRVMERKTKEGFTVGFRIDITETKAMETKLQMALFESRSAGRLSAALLPNLLHEVRTPLNAIVGFSQLIPMMSAKGDTEKVAEYSQDIEQSGRHLIELIQGLFDLADLGREANSSSEVDEICELAPLLDRACRVVQFHADARGKSITRDDLVPVALIRGNGTRLVQVVLNLLSNAIKYSPPGGNIDLKVDQSDSDSVTIWVCDDGPGISEDRRDQIFNRYERLEAEKSGIDGTGLGLAIAREFVEGLGGEIGVETAGGGGAAFWVRLPVVAQEAARPLSDGDCRKLAS